MFGPGYSDVVGYVEDGEIICVRCEEARVSERALTQVQAEEEFSDTGLYCSDCGEVIVEPLQEEEEEEEGESEDE